jgi:hypothetical protein
MDALLIAYYNFSFSFNYFNFAPNETAFLNLWLHTPRDDGKPRVLILPLDYSEARAIDKIPLFIDDTIKSVIAFWSKYLY